MPGVLAGLLPNRTQVIHLLPGCKEAGAWVYRRLLHLAGAIRNALTKRSSDVSYSRRAAVFLRRLYSVVFAFSFNLQFSLRSIPDTLFCLTLFTLSSSIKSCT